MIFTRAGQKAAKKHIINCLFDQRDSQLIIKNQFLALVYFFLGSISFISSLSHLSRSKHWCLQKCTVTVLVFDAVLSSFLLAARQLVLLTTETVEQSSFPAVSAFS